MGGKSINLNTIYEYTLLVNDAEIVIQDDLKWNVHVSNQVKKANKRMYHVRCLKRASIDNKIICLFYNSVISSVLTYAITTFFNSCNDKQVKDFDKFRKRVCKMIGSDYHDIIDECTSVHNKKCIALQKKIMKDIAHPLHYYFTMLPHNNILNMIYCRTDRFKNTFVPTSIKLYNAAKM